MLGSVLTVQSLLGILSLPLPQVHTHSLSLKINKLKKQKQKNNTLLSLGEDITQM